MRESGVGLDNVDHSLTSLGSAEPDQGARPTRRKAELLPPVLTVEQGTAMHELKPFLKAVADVNRLAILQELSNEDGLSVLDLADRLVLSQPLTSWHLHILKRARLVTPTQLGRQHVYRLNKHRLQEYRDLFIRVTQF